MRTIQNVNGGSRIICPAGTHNSVLNEIYDLGLFQGFDNPEERVFKRGYVFLTDKRIKGGKHDGEPYVVSAIINDSKYSKGKLYSLIRSLCGREFTDEEMSAIDIDTLIGKPAIIEVTHEQKNGQARPQITKISRHMSGLPVLQREPDRETPPWVTNYRAKRLDKSTDTYTAVDNSVAVDTSNGI